MPLNRGCRMGLTFAENTRTSRRNFWNFPFCVALLLSVWLIGCNNTCFTFTSNSPTGTIDITAGNPETSCRLAKANGAVRLAVQTVPMCSSCSESGRIHHILVSIRGIEIHPSTTANDDSADWQELAPELVKQPLQVDLVRGTADRVAREPLGEIVAIPGFIVRRACVSCQISRRRRINFRKRMLAGVPHSTVSSWRMVAFSRSCLMAARQSFASSQTELSALLFSSLLIPTLI